MGIAPSGSSWFQQNAPTSTLNASNVLTAPGTAQPGVIAPGATFASMAGNPSATPSVQPNSATGAIVPPAGTATATPSGQPTSFASVPAYVQWLSQQPGADPTLASDPTYWIGKITDTGGLTAGNIGYWNTRSQAGAGNTTTTGSAGAGSANGPLGGVGFQAPAPFIAPTDVTQQNDPGYQFSLQQGEKAINDSAAAKGTLRTSGNVKDLDTFATGTANQNFNDVFNRDLSTYQTNASTPLSYDTLNANTLLGISGQGLTAAGDATNAGSNLAASNANLITGGANSTAAGGLAAGTNWANLVAGLDPTSLAQLKAALQQSA